MTDIASSPLGKALRKVTNLLPNPVFGTGAPSGWSTPNATLVSNTLTTTGSGGRIYNDVTPAVVNGSSVVFSADIAPGTSSTAVLTIYDVTAATVRTQQTFTMDKRERQTIRYDSWVSGNSCVCYIYVTATSGAPVGDTIKVYDAQLEKVDGQYNQNFSEFGSGTQYYAYIPASIYVWGDSLSTTWYPRELRILYQASLPDIWVHEGGVGGDTSTQIATRMLAKPDHFGDTAIIWAGRNNYTDPTTVKADIASMVAALGHTHYLILSILNNSAETSGTGNYTTLTTLNSDLAALYPSNYLDIRALLVAQYNPSLPQDVIDHANDVTPTSLRIDTLHLTLAGYEYVAAQVKGFITSKGWSTAVTAIN